MIACEIARNHPIDSNFLEVLLLPQEGESLLVDLAGKLHHSLCAADENLGHLEEQLLRGGHELFRQMLEKAAQHKADTAPPLCPHCQNKLSRLTEGHWTTIQTRFGSIRVQRARGYCKRCRKWRFDHARTDKKTWRRMAAEGPVLHPLHVAHKVRQFLFYSLGPSSPGAFLTSLGDELLHLIFGLGCELHPIRRRAENSFG